MHDQQIRGATLRTFALAAIAARLPTSPLRINESDELRFLHEQLEAATQDGREWVDSLLQYLRGPAPNDRPLVRLGEALGLSKIELLAVALAVAVERNVMVGRALAHIQAPLGGSRPTVALLVEALSELDSGRPIDLLTDGPAARSGLLTFGGEGAPVPERAVAVPPQICLALADRDASWPGMTVGLGDTPPVPLPASVVEEAGRVARGLQAAGRVLVIRTGSQAEGRSVALTIAQALTRRPLFVESDTTTGLAPWLLLRQLLPVFSFDLGPGERKRVPALPLYPGPILVLCGRDGTVETAGGAALSWSLSVPSQEERLDLWQTAIGKGDLADDMARDHRHGSGRIAMLGRLARQRARLQNRAAPLKEDLAATAWLAEGVGLEALAEPLTDPISDKALVTTKALKEILDTLVLRCKLRDSLVKGLGSSATARYHPGVRALFIGPSGTGKTLAAGWLATTLGLPLYRVDLAGVTSKYIGETEKNLAQLLDRAEQAEVVLLFDEADSLFGKRTDVREANDRFANAQTNYLLQRIESFDGIAILTSNSRARFDTAFARRLDLIVDFPLPGPEERRRLWESHLGTEHALSPREVNQLAAGGDLTGGHIRNVVLTAAVIAQGAKRKIELDDILQGLAAEYKKMGRQVPADLARSPDGGLVARSRLSAQPG